MSPVGITKGGQNHCKFSPPALKLSQPFSSAWRKKKTVFLFPCQVASVLVSMTAERGHKSQALTYRGIKSHPLGKQAMIPGEPWKLESVGFLFIQQHSMGLQKGDGVANIEGRGGFVRAFMGRSIHHNGNNKISQVHCI